MAGSFEQFIKFATDASGLERTFRFLQAIAQTLIFFAPTQSLLFQILTFLSPDGHQKLQPLSLSVLSTLRARFAIGRRYFRVFRFLESFNSAWTLYHRAAGAEGMGLEKWLDVSAKSFNGMYLLLETMTFLDALGVEGLGIWGGEVGGMLVVEAQRFWLFALVCGVGAGGVRLWNGSRGRDGKKKGEREKKGQGGDGQRERWLKEEVKREEQSRRILRRLVADVMDIGLPGAVVGWVPVSPGTVGLLMLGSTWLTGLEVWERCGRELDATKA